MIGYYRVTFQDQARSYYSGFQDAGNAMYPTIRRIIENAEQRGIKDIWWFLEPYAEVTWHAEDDSFLAVVKEIVQQDKMDTAHYREFKPGGPGDRFDNWFGKNSREIDASTTTYAEIRKVSQALLDNKHVFEDGLSLDAHYQRTLHVLANQMGMNYLDEGFACFKHGLISLGFFFSNPHAVAALLRKFKIKNGLTVV